MLATNGSLAGVAGECPQERRKLGAEYPADPRNVIRPHAEREGPLAVGGPPYMTLPDIRVQVRCHHCQFPVEKELACVWGAQGWDEKYFHRGCLPPDVACCELCGDVHEKRDMGPWVAGTKELLCRCCRKGMGSGTD